MSNKQFTYLTVGIVVLAIVVILMFDNGFFKARNGVAKKDQGKREEEKTKPENDRPPGEGFVKIGGIWRKESEIGEPVKPNTEITENVLPSPGQSPLVKSDLNSQVASINEALKSKKHPERLSAFRKPSDFDKAAFEKDPKKFINTIEPARAMMPAQPGPDVTPIRRNSPGLVKLIQGESTTFEVQAAKNAFIAFHTTDLGTFSNGIKTINVRADENGVAQATYTATKGTIGNVHVVAASPYNSELARFTVIVRLPEPTAKIDR